MLSKIDHRENISLSFFVSRNETFFDNLYICFLFLSHNQNHQYEQVVLIVA